MTQHQIKKLKSTQNAKPEPPMPFSDYPLLEFSLALLQILYQIFPAVFIYIAEVYGPISIRIMLEGSIALIHFVIFEYIVVSVKRLLVARFQRFWRWQA